VNKLPTDSRNGL